MKHGARHNGPHKDWTKAAEQRLRKGWAEGMSIRQLAEAFGTTKNAIVGKMRRMKLPNRQVHVRKDAAAEPPKPVARRVGLISLPPLPSLSGPD